jgi:hypothetical protein
MQGGQFLINGEPRTHGFCSEHGLIRFTLRGNKMIDIDRETAKRYYHQTKELLEGSAEDAHMRYTDNHPERIKYEKKMAELVKKFLGIDQ